MAMRRRRKTLRRLVKRHRSFLIVLLLLSVMALSYFVTIKSLQERALLQNTSKGNEKVPDLLEDPRAFIIAERGQAFEDVEVFLNALLLCIPVSFSLIAIVCIIQVFGRGNQYQSKRHRSPEQLAKEAAMSAEVKRKFRRE